MYNPTPTVSPIGLLATMVRTPARNVTPFDPPRFGLSGSVSLAVSRRLRRPHALA